MGDRVMMSGRHAHRSTGGSVESSIPVLETLTYGEQKKGRQKIGWQEELEKGRVEARREERRPQVVAEEGRAEVALGQDGRYDKEAGTVPAFLLPIARAAQRE